MTKLTPFERSHAESILDNSPVLEPIPPEKVIKILVGAVIRKPPEVIRPWLQTLTWQRFRGRKVELSFNFILDLEDYEHAEELKEIFSAFQKEQNCSIGHAVGPNAFPAGSYAEGPRTRQWTEQGFRRMGDLKNAIIQNALNSDADYLWFVDADVFTEPYCLHSLLASEEAIVAGVYWTDWQRPSKDDAERQHAGPQVWLRHPYELSNQEYTEPAFRKALVNRQRIAVKGLGACTLITKEALQKGVNFTKQETLPPGGMGDGEDRHFCHRADNLHLGMVADAWPDIYHAYHPDEYDKIPEVMQMLDLRAAESGVPPADVVSVKLMNLEFNQFGPLYLRGTLAQLGLLPEIADAICGMEPGDNRPVKVHFPSYYGEPQLANKSCIIHVSLIDTKVPHLPPVIDREWLWSNRSQQGLDTTTLTSEQIEEVMVGATN